ncbi:MAG: hypothetical protein ACI86H_000515 [bacterium]|jgi:hypothetical protein
MNTFFKLFLLVFSGSLIACTAVQQQSSVTEDPTEINFIYRMEEGKKEQGWCKVYFHSFNDTRESHYLKLSAKHCSNAVRSYHKLQFELSHYTEFHFQARERRMQSCQFYQRLKVASADFQIPIVKLSSAYCLN